MVLRAFFCDSSAFFGDFLLWSGILTVAWMFLTSPIAEGTPGTACTETEWKVEEGIISPGGIFWANFNTAKLCKDRWAQSPQCLAVDLVDEAGRVLCYHHIKTYSLREVIKVAGAAQHTIIKRCTTGVDDGPSPGLASECRRLWAKRDNFFSLGGKFLTDIRSAAACREACVQQRSCFAVDIQWGTSALDDSLVCQLHVDNSKLLVPLLKDNTEQWELVERCTLVDVDKTRDFTAMPFQEDGCVKEWEERENTHYVGGAHFTAPISTILTPRTCLAACVFEKNCIAVDMNFGRSPTECWLFTAIANRSKSYSPANIRHYYLAKGCAPNNTTPEEDVGSGSDGGEDSGDPDPVRPAPKKPRDPKQLSQTELGQVSKSLVERACEDFAYYDVAAPLCGYICKNEEGKQDLNTIPDARFVCPILEARSQCISVATNFWINVCFFLARLYIQTSLPEARFYELECLLFKVFEFLWLPSSVENQDEVNALAMVYSGQELCAAEPTAFDSLVCNLRNTFIKGTDIQSNSILLMLIELYASNCTLRDVTKEYYGLL